PPRKIWSDSLTRHTFQGRDICQWNIAGEQKESTQQRHHRWRPLAQLHEHFVAQTTNLLPGSFRKHATNKRASHQADNGEINVPAAKWTGFGFGKCGTLP